MKKLSRTKQKEVIRKEIEDEDIFIPIQWPEVQDFMEEPGFRENSLLIDSDPLYQEYGDSAYMIRKSWLQKL